MAGDQSDMTVEVTLKTTEGMVVAIRVSVVELIMLEYYDYEDNAGNCFGPYEGNIWVGAPVFPPVILNKFKSRQQKMKKNTRLWIHYELSAPFGSHAHRENWSFPENGRKDINWKKRNEGSVGFKNGTPLLKAIHIIFSKIFTYIYYISSRINLSIN